MDANCSLFCGLSHEFASKVGLESFELRLTPRESAAFSLVGILPVRFRTEFAPEKFLDWSLTQFCMCELGQGLSPIDLALYAGQV